VLNFITSYMPLFFTAFVYIPFGNLLLPYLDFWRATAQKLAPGDRVVSTMEFQINPDRISKQMFYFTVTAQVVSFATEVVVPYLKRKASHTVKEVQSEIAARNGGKATQQQDPPEEAAFLTRVRNEATLEVYDVTADYREMVIQFGELTNPGVAP
jgi:anoctamin-10